MKSDPVLDLEIIQAWERMAPELLQKGTVWMGGNREGAEEALSRVAAGPLLDLAVRSEKVENLRAWFFKLIYHSCMDIHRETKRRSEFSIDDYTDDWTTTIYPNPLATYRTPEDVCLQGELEAKFHRWVHQLPARLREPFVRQLAQQSYVQIADSLAITQENVRKRIQHAREALARRLDGYLKGNGDVSWKAATQILGDLTFDNPSEGCDAAFDELRIQAFRSVTLHLDDELEKSFLLRLRYRPRKVTSKRIASLEKYIDRHPTGWKKRLEIGRLLQEIGCFGQAIAHYRSALEKNPRCLSIWLELAFILESSNRDEDVDELYREALGQLRGVARSYMRGCRAIWLGERESAEKVFQTLITEMPGSTVLLTDLARLRLESGRLFEASEGFDRVLEIDPDHLEALVLGHDALLAAGRTEEALGRQQRALQLDASNPLVLGRIIEHRCFAGLVDGEEAVVTRRFLRKLSKLAGAEVDTLRCRVAYHLARGEEQQAASRIGAFALAHPRHWRGRLAGSRLWTWLGDAQQAMRAVESMSASGHQELYTDAEACQVLCRVYSRAGRRRKVQELVDEAVLRNFTAHWQTMATAAEALCEVDGDAGLALEISRCASKLQPRLAVASFSHARVLAWSGDSPAALEVLAGGWGLVTERDGSSIRASLLQAACHASCGEDAQSERWYLEALRMANASTTDLARVAAWRGQAYEGLGNLQEAVAAYRSAVAMHVRHPLRADVLAALKRLRG